ncbi:hypothetical protein [Streptomyces sp. NPDC005538]|uniref:hypothetical protein n=1 Tax=unclassified Streptomyces TaxID=2593676 RepID=UPI0033BB999B
MVRRQLSKVSLGDGQPGTQYAAHGGVGGPHHITGGAVSPYRRRQLPHGSPNITPPLGEPCGQEAVLTDRQEAGARRFGRTPLRGAQYAVPLDDRRLRAVHRA